MDRPKVYEYADYRDFLKASLTLLKKRTPIYSIAKTASEVGCSESFLKKIFSKKTHLGFTHAGIMFEVLRLTEAEKECVYCQMIHDRSLDPTLRRFMMKTLMQLTENLKLSERPR